jgi:YD repeat-containing protein
VRDGFWDATERRFGGFLGTIVTTWGATPAETSSVQTRYLPGQGASRLLRGKPLVEQVRDGTGRRLSMTTNTWDTQAVTGLPDAPLLRRAILRESKTRYEDTSPAREAKITYEYDGLGRARRTTNWGRLDLDFDQTVEEKTYADDGTTWVRDRVCEDKVLGSDGQLVSDTQYLFGNESTTLPLCSGGKGWPRETRAWLASESRFVTQESTSYDAHANPVQLTRNGVTREISYDADGLFPIEERAQVTDDRELVWRMTWDKVLGAAVDLEDPNGHHNHVRYDGLGRTVGMSFDGRPEHVLFEYDWSGTFPKTTTWQFDGKLDDVGALPGAWADANHWRQSVQVSNGRGEPRYRAERLGLTSWIISDYRERDPASRVTFQGRPIRTDRLELTARPTGMVGESLVYDPLGRLLEQRLPNGGKRVYTYTEFERTVKLDDLATTHMVTDGQGRVIQTDRTLADGTQQRIDARYDAASRLVSMVLGANQVTRSFEYDTLGRMTRSNDPDLGARQLFYDDDNRLTDETNALGETTHYAYDGGGRVVARGWGGGTPYR